MGALLCDTPVRASVYVMSVLRESLMRVNMLTTSCLAHR
jgi:hypothetical protein